MILSGEFDELHFLKIKISIEDHNNLPTMKQDLLFDLQALVLMSKDHVQ